MSDQPMDRAEWAAWMTRLWEAQTARNWRTRGVLPEPDWTVSGGPAWSWPRVAAWAMRTGRL